MLHLQDLMQLHRSPGPMEAPLLDNQRLDRLVSQLREKMRSVIARLQPFEAAGTAGQLAPIDEMAASLVHEHEAVIAQEPAHFGGGKWPEFRHGPVEGAGRCRPVSSDA